MRSSLATESIINYSTISTVPDTFKYKTGSLLVAPSTVPMQTANCMNK